MALVKKLSQFLKLRKEFVEVCGSMELGGHELSFEVPDPKNKVEIKLGDIKFAESYDETWVELHLQNGHTAFAQKSKLELV